MAGVYFCECKIFFMPFPSIRINGNYESGINTKLANKIIQCGIEHTGFADGIRPFGVVENK